MNTATMRALPAFSLARLLKSVFEPEPGERIAILIDLPDPKQVAGFAFLQDASLTIQRHAHDDILFSPSETPEIIVTQALMFRDGRSEVVIEHYRPAPHLQRALSA